MHRRHRREPSTELDPYALLDAINAAVVVADLDTTVTHWNPGAAFLFGWTAEEAVGCRTGDLLGTTGSDISAVAHATLARGDGWEGELWVRHASGRSLLIATTLDPVVDPTGRLVGMVALSRSTALAARDDANVRRLAAIVGASTDAILSKTPEGIITAWNDGAERIYGYTAGEAIGRHVSMLVPPDRRPELDGILARVVAGIRVERLETVRRCRDGHTVQVVLTVWPIQDYDGAVIGATAVTQDITRTLAVEHQRQEAETRFRAAFRRSPVGMVIADLEGRPTAVNAAACRLLGRPAGELLGRPWSSYLATDDRPLEPAEDEADAPAYASFSTERRLDREDGSIGWVQTSTTLVRNAAGGPAFLMTQLIDATERTQLMEELAHRALHDSLTGLPNRALLGDRLGQMVAAATLSGHQTGVAFIDIDSFKTVNDVLGHRIGDRLLTEMGDRLTSIIRPADTVARFGGDEFVVVCEHASVEAMGAFALRVLGSLGRAFEVDGQDVTLNASVGITSSRFGSTSESLLSEADAAMYRAKELGPGRVVAFDDHLRERAKAMLDGERSLRSAIADHELVAHFQPIVEMASGRPRGVEALVRWHAPDGRVVPPSEFIGLAESTGLIVPLGEQVLDQAVEAVARWNRGSSGPPLHVSVNLAARQLVIPDLVGLVDGVLCRHGLPPELLTLEITETAVMEDVVEGIAVLNRLKSLGLMLAIDDFGTGYSSMAYLQQLPIDVLKIDASFIAGIGSRPVDASIVRAIVGLADAMDVRCLAEGVETEAQRTFLAELGCAFGQGYLWGRPMAPDDARAWAAGLGG